MRASAPFLQGATAGFLLATSARALLSTLFSLSLATLRLNGSATWTLALAAPLLAAVVPRGRWPLVLATAAAAALPLARFTDAFVPLAGVATATSLVAIARAQRPALDGVLVGVALNGAFLVTGTSHDPALTFWGAGLLIVVALPGLLSRPPETTPPRRDAPAMLAGLAFAALLALQLAYLASPYALHTRTNAPAWLLAVLSVAGLLTGMSNAHLRRAWPILSTLALVDLALLQSPLAIASVFLLQASLGAAMHRLAPPNPWIFGAAFAPLGFSLLFFSQNAGPLEWRLLVPALAAPPLLLALRAPTATRARPRLAVLAIALLLTVPAWLPGAPITPPEEGEPLRVVTWNIHQAFGNRGGLDPETYTEALRDLAPDLLILQESDTARISSGGLDIAHLLSRELGLHRHTSGSGIHVLSRFPLLPGTEANVTAWSAQMTLDVHGQGLHVQGIHLARRSADRADQVAQILESATHEPGPRLLAGDLNSCAGPTCFGGRPSDGVHQQLDAAYDDAWTLRHGDDSPQGATHPSRAPVRRIDVILVHDLVVLEADPIRTPLTMQGSDHLPVLALVRMPSE